MFFTAYARTTHSHLIRSPTPFYIPPLPPLLKKWFEHSPASKPGSRDDFPGEGLDPERGGPTVDGNSNADETQALLEKRMELEAGLAGGVDAERGRGDGSIGFR